MDGNLFQQLAQESCNECTASRSQGSRELQVLVVGLRVGEMLLSCHSFLFSPVGYLCSRTVMGTGIQGAGLQDHNPLRGECPAQKQEEGVGKSHSPALRPHVIAGLFLKRY